MYKEKIINILNNENAKIKDILPFLKANRYTYEGFFDKDIERFKRLYNRLKIFKEKDLNFYTKFKIKCYLKNEGKYSIEYTFKYHIIDLILCNL